MTARSKLVEEIAAKSLLDVIPDMEQLVLEHGELALYDKDEYICKQGDTRGDCDVLLASGLGGCYCAMTFTTSIYVVQAPCHSSLISTG